MKQQTLLLPATIPQEQTLSQLLLLFEDVFLYSPSEENEENNASNQLFNKYAPVPFGEDLHNFQQLLNDMTRSPADYYGSSLSALSSSTATDVDEATVWQLIEQMAPENTKSEPKKEALYQARLLLKLTEIQEQKEEEIDHSLNEINNLSSQLMAALKGEENFLETGKITPPQRKSLNSSTMWQRLTAWGHLFLSDPKAAQFPILATGQDEFDLLSDHAGPNILDAPQKMYSLTVPDFTKANQPEEFISLRNHFREISGAEDIFCVLEKAATCATADKERIEEHQKKWQQQINKKFPDTPTVTMEIYLFPNLSLPELMAKICRTSLPSEVNTSFPAHGLMVVTNQ